MSHPLHILKQPHFSKTFQGCVSLPTSDNNFSATSAEQYPIRLRARFFELSECTSNAPHDARDPLMSASTARRVQQSLAHDYSGPSSRARKNAGQQLLSARFQLPSIRNSSISTPAAHPLTRAHSILAAPNGPRACETRQRAKQCVM